MDQKTFITFEEMNWYALILSLPVPRWAGTNTDLPVNSNFSKTVRVNLHRAFLNPLNANPTKWSNTLKQFVELSNDIQVDRLCNCGSLVTDV